MSFLKGIVKLFKKLWKAIRKILAILLIVIAVCLIVWAAVFSGGAALVLFGTVISQTAAFVLGALALTGAFLIDAETSKEVVGKIGEAMGNAAGAVGGAIGDVIGGGISGVLGSPMGMWLLIGVGAYFLLSSSSDSPDKASKTVESSKDAKKPAPVRDARGQTVGPGSQISGKPAQDMSLVLGV